MQRPLWRRLLDAGTQIVLPEVCAACGMSGAWICEACMPAVKRIEGTACCRRCGYPNVQAALSCRRCADWPPLEFAVRSAFEFSGALRQSILRMKYHGEYARAIWHGEHLAELAQETDWNIDVLVPVPLHPKRMRARGYNQAEKLADSMSAQLEVGVSNWLRRTRDTPSQTTLNSNQRMTNVAGAIVSSPEICGRNVVIVDDVSTTCATILECAFACELAGALSVNALTVATDV